MAVALMLALALTNGYAALWPIFGSSNQLLAALALLVATCWLAARRRPVWYTLLPMLFMFATSITMMVRLLIVNYVPNWSTKAPLAVTAVIVLIATAGIILLALRRWVLHGGQSTDDAVAAT